MLCALHDTREARKGQAPQLASCRLKRYLRFSKRPFVKVGDVRFSFSLRERAILANFSTNKEASPTTCDDTGLEIPNRNISFVSPFEQIAVEVFYHETRLQ